MSNSKPPRYAPGEPLPGGSRILAYLGYDTQRGHAYRVACAQCGRPLRITQYRVNEVLRDEIAPRCRPCAGKSPRLKARQLYGSKALATDLRYLEANPGLRYHYIPLPGCERINLGRDL